MSQEIHPITFRIKVCSSSGLRCRTGRTSHLSPTRATATTVAYELTVCVSQQRPFVLTNEMQLVKKQQSEGPRGKVSAISCAGRQLLFSLLRSAANVCKRASRSSADILKYMYFICYASVVLRFHGLREAASESRKNDRANFQNQLATGLNRSTNVSTAKSATDLKLPHIFKVGITVVATRRMLLFAKNQPVSKTHPLVLC